MENKITSKKRKVIIIIIIAAISVFFIAAVIDTFIADNYTLRLILNKTSDSSCKFVSPAIININGIEMAPDQGPHLEGCLSSQECFLISELGGRDTCYHTFAIKEKNPKLCNKIKTEFIKKNCIENANK